MDSADSAGAGDAGAGGAAGAGGVDQGLKFSGYAAIFDRVDRGGDVVRRGAFSRTLDKPVPLLWQHAPGSVIGRIEHMAEDAHGLRVIGRISGATQAGREAGALLREGALDGLSFGYRVRGQKRLRTARELTALELVEISLVTFPMQPLARVHGVVKCGE